MYNSVARPVAFWRGQWLRQITTPITPITPTTPDGSPSTALNLIGESVGKYRVVRKLGKGGMGTVFEAVHTDIGQRLAIKILNAGLATQPKFIKRFYDEARLVSMVGHPGLVKIVDYNQLQDGTPYILMEYLEGQSLWERFRKTKGKTGVPGLPIESTLRIMRQLASALQAVHAKGIIHRDLKPDNVILIADPETPSGERAKLLDFGIAKFDKQAEGDRGTTLGAAIGTPTYMSPEQCEARPGITDRADVYALGVMWYELLNGAPPFVSDTQSGVLRQHLVKAPPPLSAHVPAAIAAIVSAMLAKEPAERPSMVEVVERIDKIDPQRMSYSGLRTVGEIAAVPQGRKRLLAIVSAALGLLSIVTLALILRGRAQVEPVAPVEPSNVKPPRIETATTPPPTANKTGNAATSSTTDPPGGTSSNVTPPARPKSAKKTPERIIFGTKKPHKKNH